jgi:hypothetical protein
MLDNAKRQSEYARVERRSWELGAPLSLLVLLLSAAATNASQAPERAATNSPRPTERAELSLANLSSPTEAAVARKPEVERPQPHPQARQLGRPKVFATRTRVQGQLTSCAGSLPGCNGYCGGGMGCKGASDSPGCNISCGCG